MKNRNTITAMKESGFELILVMILITGNLATAQVVRQPDEGINIDRSKRIVRLTSEVAGELFINGRLVSEIAQPDSLYIVNLEEKVFNLKFSDKEGQEHETGVIIPSRSHVSFHISHQGIERKDPGRRYELVARDIKGETVFYVPDNVWYMEVNYATAGALSLSGGYRFFPGLALGLGVTNQPVIGWGDEYADLIPVYLRMDITLSSRRFAFFVNADAGGSFSRESELSSGFYSAFSGGARVGLTQQLYLQLALECRLVDLTVEPTYYDNGMPYTTKYYEFMDPLYIRFGLGFQFL